MENTSINKKIRERYSPRAYTDKKLSEIQIYQLFEAARWASSAYNGQPWRFLYATPDMQERWDKMFNSLIDFNKQWVQHAPLLVAGLVKTYDNEKNAPIRNAGYQLGLSVGNMVSQAGEMGLHMRQMTGFDADVLRSNFAIPSNIEPVVMFVAGYEGSQDSLDERSRVPVGKERIRKPLNEIIFDGNWQHLQ
ncbi:MAG: nitroreductase family protein [Prolixibacteraceae bacterium]|nr:nitroreductase family protein [Prolixibacteraceae bacterium]MBN2650591.1 nitroreductase family protein [Prolixibacteraceae bacterium]